MIVAHRHHRSRAIVRLGQLGSFAIAALMLVAIARPVPARAEDRVAELSRMFASGSDKTRLAAVLALAKLGEPRVAGPLMRALRDPSPRVRGVAAAALGRLDCSAALPTLHTLARDDADPDVRNAAAAAAMKISTAHPAGQPARPDGDAAARRPPPGGERPGHTAYAVEPHPELYVLVNSSTDESPGPADPTARRAHAELIKRVLLDRLRTEPSITAIPSDARRTARDARHLDLSVTRLAATRTGDTVEIEAQLRIAISDDSGKMLSFVSGGAKLQVPASQYGPRHQPGIRRDVLDHAMRGLLDKLLAQLRNPA